MDMLDPALVGGALGLVLSFASDLWNRRIGRVRQEVAEALGLEVTSSWFRPPRIHSSLDGCTPKRRQPGRQMTGN